MGSQFKTINNKEILEYTSGNSLMNGCLPSLIIGSLRIIIQILQPVMRGTSMLDVAIYNSEDGKNTLSTPKLMNPALLNHIFFVV